ncbi:hypothetical protein [Mycolicibacterium vinylchloridicum]|uniref:hypothetical protein n=1 Tax=Mycolicibacterium vinylchloridicum TaxID=2736928 RepID=UPI0015CE9E41|nr:hypothetical protein [Mycolicibacterium vinylchloridicum]
MPSNAALPATVPVATSTDGVTRVEVGAMHHQAPSARNGAATAVVTATAIEMKTAH